MGLLSSFAHTTSRIGAAAWNGLIASLAFKTSITPQDFGAVGDGVTDDGPAFAAAIAYLKSIAVNDQTIYKASGRLRVPAGHYYLGTTTLDLTHTLIIEGEGCGQSGGIATKLRWAADTTGIRIQRYNTSGATTVDGETHYGGDSSTVRRLHLSGGYSSGNEGEYHGIHIKARCVVEDCIIDSFQGDGIFSNASGGGGAAEGNANNTFINRIRITNCRNGLYITGSDANAWVCTCLDLSGNRRWGVRDDSFLGNTHIGYHAADNGIYLPGGEAPSVVSNGGNRYCVVDDAEDTASVTAPTGTADTANWIYMGPGDPLAAGGYNIPAWSSGMTLRSGGCYLSSGGSGGTTFINCYNEGGQGLSQFSDGCLTLHGIGLRHGYGGLWASTVPGGLNAKRLSIAGNLNATGVATFGPSTGVADGSMALLSTNNSYFIDVTNASGALGYVWFLGGNGSYYNTADSGWKHQFRVGGSDVALVNSAGLDLASGKAYKVNGTQVVGAQGSAVAADATDLATALTLVNQLKSRLRAHGLIA
jgi:hypothetical protein